MWDIARIQVLKREIQPPSMVVGSSTSSEPPHNDSLLHTPLSLMMSPESRLGTSSDRQDSVFDND